MITIKKSKTADTRSCDFSKVSKEQLIESSIQHIGDVKQGLDFWKVALERAAILHDFDKISEINSFHSDFITGFKTTNWWENHQQVNRHHLFEKEGVPSDVNLIDVLELITDCVMAGMGRTGEVYPFKLDLEVLQKAFDNTVELMKKNVQVEE